MTPSPDAQTLMQVCEATWPPASSRLVGPWRVRTGAGGGKRVSSTTQEGHATEADIASAEAAMRALGQPLLFQIRPGEEALDAWLETRGYEVIDPVTTWIILTNDLRDTGEKPAQGSIFSTFPPLALMRELWAQGGIGPGRLDVMERATEPKTALIARRGDHAAGVAYVGISQGVAMLHALHVAPDQRRKGMARALMREAAVWAGRNGGDWFALLVTTANEAANPLYASLGMRQVGRYHYRVKP